MKEYLYSIAFCAAAVLVSTSTLVLAQESHGVFLTAGVGAISYTNEYSTHSWETPENPGYLGRVGVDVAFERPPFSLSAEYERSSVSQQYDPRHVGICRNFNPPDVCDGEPSDLYAVTFLLRSKLGAPIARVTPYLLVGGGWIRERNVRRAETIGPKTDLGFGLALDPFLNGFVQVAIEPRYTFFYFLDEPEENQPSHVSVALVSRVRLTKW